MITLGLQVRLKYKQLYSVIITVLVFLFHIFILPNYMMRNMVSQIYC